MPERRLQRNPWSRLGFSLGLSVVLHGIVLSSFGSASFSSRKHSTGLQHFEFVVRLTEVMQPTIGAQTWPLDNPGAAKIDPAPRDPVQDTVAQVAESVTPPPPSGQTVHTGPAGIISGPWYYAARYLHRRPTPLKPIRPDYPKFVGDTPGRVVLLLLINEQGKVDTYRILEADPSGIFNNEVVAAFTHERYAPGLIASHPVRSQLLVEIVFEPGAIPQANVLTDFPR